MTIGDWRLVRLADLCESIDYGFTASASVEPIGPRFLRITDIVQGFTDWNAVPFCSIEDRRMNKFHLTAGDIVIARTGANTGASAYIKDPPDAVFASYLVRLRINRELAYPRFVAYYLKSPNYWGYVHGVLGDKSAQPNASARTLTQARLSVPPLPVQRATADLLGAIDDKIELNRRMNETQEGIARAIFKSWFVDFDPVRAKVEGRRPYGMNAEIAGRFPSAFEEAFAGPIPSGWRWDSIAGIAKYVNGRNFTKDATGFGRMVIRIAELNSGPGASTVFNQVDAESVNIAKPDDVLFAWSGSLGVYRWHRDEALINQHIFKVVCDEFPQWFVFYQLLESMDYFREIASHKATTMGHIKRGHLTEVAVPLPPQELLTAASRTIDPICRQIHVLERESQTLAALRDTLLPKLISGEVRIRDAEQMAEAAL